MRKAGPIIGILIALLVAGVAFLNQSAVTLDLWFTQVTIPLWALIAGTFLLGLLTGLLFMLPFVQRRGTRIKELEEELEETKRKRDSIAEETRRESEADLAQKNSEINGLMARIESLEADMRERIRNSQGPSQRTVSATETEDTVPYDQTSVEETPPVSSRTERRADNRSSDATDENQREASQNEAPDTELVVKEVDETPSDRQ